VVANFQIFDDPSQSNFTAVFPRLINLNLDGSLIQAHLDIFKVLQPMFQIYLETREKINTDSRDWKSLKKRNGIIGIPPMMTSEKWRTMSTNEKYTAVFGPQDPSRRKLEDLPYFVKLVSRESEGKCVFCRREECSGCPLRFDDKITLRQILAEAKVVTESNFYYEEHKPVLL
jgi:hypothetical protein